MTSIHIITHLFPPHPGGLESWTLHLAETLSKSGFRIIVHILDSSTPLSKDRAKSCFITKYLASTRKILEEPLYGSNWHPSRIEAERQRIEFLVLRNSIREESGNDLSRSILVSNFLTASGFVTSSVAEELGLRHIACVVGTDFSRGVRNIMERAKIEFVLKQATVIVTKSSEQTDYLLKHFNVSSIKTIPTAVDFSNARFLNTSNPHKIIHLFSDIGYSHKKGTTILWSAYKTLQLQGWNLTLTICGSMLEGQESFWTNWKLKPEHTLDTSLILLDHLTGLEIANLIEKSSIYCSPTLGEGSSSARIFALCSGIPVVTTRCGEMTDLPAIPPFLNLCATGDPEGFTNALSFMCERISKSNPAPNEHILKILRNHFSIETEKQKWTELLLNIINS